MSIVADAVFCDDIRQETTGKFFFVGVYPGDLIPSAMPAQFPMAFMFRVWGLPAGEHKFEATIVSPSGVPVFEQKDTFNIVNDRVPIVLIFSQVIISIETPGELVATIQVAGETLTAGRLPVMSPPQIQ